MKVGSLTSSCNNIILITPITKLKQIYTGESSPYSQSIFKSFNVYSHGESSKLKVFSWRPVLRWSLNRSSAAAATGSRRWWLAAHAGWAYRCPINCINQTQNFKYQTSNCYEFQNRHIQVNNKIEIYPKPIKAFQLSNNYFFNNTYLFLTF